MAYLQQIATKPNGAKSPQKGGNFLDLPPKVLYFVVGGLILAVLIIVIGSIMGNRPAANTSGPIERISLRSKNLNTALTKYSRELKSSNLRSMATSLSSVMSGLESSSATILKSDFGKTSSTDKAITAEETALITSLNETLDNAKLNGLLDRTFVREITSQISTLIILNTDSLKKLSNPTSKTSLQGSLENLQNLHEQFSNYTDRTN